MRYEKYKDSGIDWIGDIPEHWEVKKMKFLFIDFSKKNMPNETLLSVTQNQGVVPRDWVENRMVMPSGNLESFKFIEKGDFCISLRSFEGGLEYCFHSGIVSPAYTVLKAIFEHCDSYYKYLFKSQIFIDELQLSIVGIREGKNISYELLKYDFLTIPPIQEQEAIANFLDDKTTKIDALVQTKTQQIEKLKELRQAKIHQAVTKGIPCHAEPVEASSKTPALNKVEMPVLSEVEMKDSGVEWIGEIPKHWEVKRLKYIFDIIQTGTTPSTSNEKYFEGEIPWYNPKDLNNEILLDSERKISDLAIYDGSAKLFSGDSILIVGIGATAGKTSYLKNASSFNQQITGFYSKSFFNYYYFYYLKNIGNVMLSLAQFTTLPILNNEFFKKLILPVPPIQEQQQIVLYLDKVTTKIDQAIAQKQEQIVQLKEYKQSLINDVVTGKIKVY